MLTQEGAKCFDPHCFGLSIHFSPTSEKPCEPSSLRDQHGMGGGPVESFTWSDGLIACRFYPGVLEGKETASYGVIRRDDFTETVMSSSTLQVDTPELMLA